MRERLRRLLGDQPAPATPTGDPRMAELDALDDRDRRIAELALPHTLTGVARLQALIDAVRHVERRALEGDFAECGVWRGGSVLAMAATLQQAGAEREIHLFDTFEGMTEPTEHDVSPHDGRASEAMGEWAYLFDPADVGEEAVLRNVLSTGYPEARVHPVKGPVEQTLPAAAPERLALLRLDTDWYESTRHELLHLYPRLVPGGVLIIDDYGHWEGARRAVDEYFGSHAEPVLLQRIDYTGRLAIKA